MASHFEHILSNDFTICIVGLGYVGLPLAIEFSRSMNVVGFDIDVTRVDELKKGHDANGDYSKQDLDRINLIFSSSEEILEQADIYILALPTPITKYKTPDLSFLIRGTEFVANHLRVGDLVIFESTVFPGCTTDVCIPILESNSGLLLGKDFKVGYSPERINPGDPNHTLRNTVKVVSANDEEGLKLVCHVYNKIIDADLYPVSNLIVAESSKIVENIQRDVNIALMNELSMIFDRLNINTKEVIEAAGTKWNFVKYYPGLVGGHCISVDPYYLTHKAQELGYYPEIILSGRKINDNISKNVAKKAIQMIGRQDVNLSDSRILVMGVTFKENVRDIRNSKVIDLVLDLQSYQIEVDILDEHANKKDIKEKTGLSIINSPSKRYHCIIVAVKHDEYLHHSESHFKELIHEGGGLIDIKGIYTGRIKDLNYWTL